jgi:hypothetical protein
LGFVVVEVSGGRDEDETRYSIKIAEESAYCMVLKGGSELKAPATSTRERGGRNTNIH